jgi:NAD(P)-dependent dehydrogenase (short-subunit alcohol dehydrogenase family)
MTDRDARHAAAAERIAARFSLRERRALITGGSLGIGRAITRILGDAGAAVAIQFAAATDDGYGKRGAAAELVDELRASGMQAAAIEADFERPGAARATAERAIAELGAIDILVCAAAVQHRIALDGVTDAQIDRQTQINFKATIELLQATVPAMRARRWGRVLTIGSVNQLRPEPELSVYAALKSAQHNLIVNLARRHAAEGVTFNNLAPGLVATDRNRWRREDPEVWRGIERAANPMARAAVPEEMAGAALLLCSDAGSFITGCDLQASGGGHL